MSAALKYCLFALFAAAFFVLAARFDLALRARSAWRLGEKYSAWTADPSLKAAALERDSSERLKALDADLASGALGRADYEDRKELVLAEKKFRESESPARYAYFWYRTAAAHFASPPTRWSRDAAVKAEAAARKEAEPRTK